MSFTLNLNHSIVVPICTEWLTFQDYGLLECCSQAVQSLFLRLSTQYSSRFRLLLEASMVMPITVGIVKWFDQHPWDFTVLYEFNETTLSIIRQEISQGLPIASLTPVVRTSDLVTCFRSIQRMEVSVQRSLREDEVLFLRNFCENLQELCIRKISYYNQFFFINPPFMPTLKVFHLSKAPNCMSAILRQAVSLQRLRVGEELDNLSFLSTVAIHCRNLTSLDILHIRGTHQVTAFFIIAFHCSKPFSHLQLPDVGSMLIRSLLVYRGGSLLSSLVCAPSKDHYYEGYLEDIAELAPQLTSLTPSDLTITTSLLTFIQLHFPQLKVLDLKYCDIPYQEDAVQMILTKCTQISQLFLRSTKISDETFTSLFKGTILPRVNSGITLILMSSPQLTDSTLLCLSQLCPALTSLSLLGLPKITDPGLLPILQKCRLKKLVIHGCGLTEATINHIAAYSHGLCYLYTNIQHSVDSLLEVVRCCRRMTFLQSYTIDGINRAEVQALVKNINSRLGQ